MLIFAKKNPAKIFWLNFWWHDHEGSAISKIELKNQFSTSKMSHHSVDFFWLIWETFLIKVHIFWESHKIWQNPPFFTLWSKARTSDYRWTELQWNVDFFNGPTVSYPWHFKSNEDIITKFKCHGLQIIRINRKKSGWSGITYFFLLFPPHKNGNF